MSNYFLDFFQFYFNFQESSLCFNLRRYVKKSAFFYRLERLILTPCQVYQHRSAAVTSATVFAAVSFVMVMVLVVSAVRIGIVFKFSGRKSFSSLVG